MAGVRGAIFDIKRFAVHDGPGIRTTVFVKGCMLRCAWCQNPEGLDSGIGLWHFRNLCIRCGRCVEACPERALELSPDGVRIDRSACVSAGKCVEACPSGAMAFDGREVESGEIVSELLRDRLFYELSGGGVTLSGGDPMFQPEFSLAILAGARKEGIHTAVETCLAAESETVDAFLSCADLFIVDLKIADSVAHREWTGRGNELIKSNFTRLISAGADCLARIPLIPGATATERNLLDLARFVRETAPEMPVELINYNPLGRIKYVRMGLDPRFGEDLKPYDDYQVEQFESLLMGAGVRVAGRG